MAQKTEYPVYKEGYLEWGCIDAKDAMTLDNPPITIKSWIEGPRWADFCGFLREIEWHYPELSLRFMSRRGWFRERILYEFSGPKDLVHSVEKYIERAVEDYNKYLGN